jgi:hypothetical protein
MIELVFNAPDMATLEADAERLGFVDADGNILTNGSTPDGGGWFLNVVGTVYEPIVGPIDPDNPPTPVARPGIWGRLRLNGGSENLPPFSDSITKYGYDPTADKWVNIATGADAPEWVANVGVIA